MGIDARILLRVKGEAPSAGQLKTWSWNLASSVGAEHFYFDRDVGKPVITLSDGAGKVYSQDGDDVLAEPGETLLEVHTWSRWYGVGYERGDLITLCAIAEWCEANIPTCEVWYGGDSSGVIAAPWPDSERRKLRRHLYTEEGRTYCVAACGPEEKPKGPPTCALCVPDRGMIRVGSSGDGHFSSWHCKGCGETITTHDGGASWKAEK